MSVPPDFTTGNGPDHDPATSPQYSFNARLVSPTLQPTVYTNDIPRIMPELHKQPSPAPLTAKLRLCVLIFVPMTVLMTGYVAWRFGLNSPPSATGDEPSYDAIGLQIALGNGFNEDFTNPEFRKPYEEAARTNPELMTLPDAKPGIVTYRPPLFPLTIAAADWLCGRQFWVTRTMNIAAMMLTTSLLFCWVRYHQGKWAAVCAVILFVGVDVRVRLYARAILTESLALLLATFLTILLTQWVKHPRLRYSIAIGCTIGLSLLNRTAIVFWLPFIALGMAFIYPKIRRPNDTLKIRCQHICLVMTTAVVIYAPWGIRNCVVLNRFMPTGTQGLMELSAAFSDEAVLRDGIWFNLDNSDFFAGIQTVEMTRIERELARADYSKAKALQWIADHPVDAVRLGPMKIVNEYRPHSVTEFIVLVLAIIGILLTWRSLETRIFAFLHLANAVMIALTWSVEGRFVVPLLFSLHALAIVAVWQSFQSLRCSIGGSPPAPSLT
ncbi:MAG: glycosyltransferase family 39 protein [Planctomycetaceae bacterium]|nr:glycosyltransferase family 39 protein [Planctomycetaceae bacterium]